MPFLFCGLRSYSEAAVSSRRQQRVAELIREEIADILARKVGDERVRPVSITAVEVSPDLALARVFASVLGDEEARNQALEALRHATPFIRHELAPRLQLRQVPELLFQFDPSVQRGARVDELLRRIHEEQKDRTPRSDS
jgi:ribosome-binding factor A